MAVVLLSLRFFFVSSKVSGLLFVTMKKKILSSKNINSCSPLKLPKQNVPIIRDSLACQTRDVMGPLCSPGLEGLQPLSAAGDCSARG